MAVLLLPLMSHAAEVQFRAAGSLKAAMTDIIEQYQTINGVKVQAQFAPSGLLRQRIENGEQVAVFASANMKHPEVLSQAGKGGPVVMFARNQLCALAQPDVKLTSSNLLDMILRPDVRLGTSTPKADPAGDYAFKVFERAEVLRPGSQALLSSKALQLTGGPQSAKAPQGQNPYAWMMSQQQADIFLTYCTNAVLAKKQVPRLQIVNLPAELAVGANYGMLVLDKQQVEAWQLALFILSPQAQAILATYGFEAPLAL